MTKKQNKTIKQMIVPRMRPDAPVVQRGAAGAAAAARLSVRPEQPERAVTMSFTTGATESQRRHRDPSSRRHTAAEAAAAATTHPAAGCPGEREGWWHRRTLSSKTSSGVQVVSPPRVGATLGVFLGGMRGGGGGGGGGLGPGLCCWNTAFYVIIFKRRFW